MCTRFELRTWVTIMPHDKINDKWSLGIPIITIIIGMQCRFVSKQALALF